MTRKEKIHSVFSEQKLNIPPVSLRLDLWHTHAVSTKCLPGQLAGFSAEYIEDYLGFALAARFRPNPTLNFNSQKFSTNISGDDTIEILKIGRHELKRITRRTIAEKASGIRGSIIEYPVKEIKDLDLLAETLPGACLKFDDKKLVEFIKSTGERGLPMYLAGPNPAHEIMLRWTGYENFYYFYNDYPEKIERLVDAMDAIYRRDLWLHTAHVPCELILHGAHFSASTTPKPLFERFFLPYFSEFNAMLHTAGKKILWHADADLGHLAPLVLAAGFDGADCLATRPLVNETMSDYHRIWGDRIVRWGGIPSTLTAPEVSVRDFQSYLLNLKEECAGSRSVIIGASDNIMPGAQWEKLEAISEIFECRSFSSRP